MIKSLYPKFQPWSDGGSVMILSDTHFEDFDCKLMDKNWITPQEQIDIINSKVMKCDTFVHLGDVGNPEWMNKIKAHYKVLIMGNHDQSIKKFESYFDEVYTGPLFIGEKILLSHEPIYGLSWCLNIHGHNHSANPVYSDTKTSIKLMTMVDVKTHINLAANVCGYTPVNLDRLIKGGCLSGIDNIHRQTIDLATWERERKNKDFKDFI